MKRLTLRLAAALSTFLFGIAITGLLTLYPFRSTEKISVAIPLAAKLKINTPPAGWKKVDVNKQFTRDVEKIFSFYLPPDMREYVIPSEINFGQPPARFINKDLDFGFGYELIDRQENEALWQGKMTCDTRAEEHPGMSLSQSEEVEIGGRRAMQSLWKLDNPPSQRITLCFPNVGDGTILRMWLGADGHSLDVANQIISTIEFPN